MKIVLQNHNHCLGIIIIICLSPPPLTCKYNGRNVDSPRPLANLWSNILI